MLQKWVVCEKKKIALLKKKNNVNVKNFFSAFESKNNVMRY